MTLKATCTNTSVQHAATKAAVTYGATGQTLETARSTNVPVKQKDAAKNQAQVTARGAAGRTLETARTNAPVQHAAT